MNRMHPEDLRANIAMKFVELHVKACQCNVSYSEMIEKADNFIAELKRTAKPEPDTKDATIALDDIANVCDHPRWEYPGQVTRYVIELKTRLHNAMTFVVKAEARVQELEAENQSLERAADVLIEDRDAYHDHADRLVTAIERHLGIECGEHSNANCPWDNAVEFLDSVRPLEEVKKERDALQSRLSAIDAARDSKEAQP